MNIMDIKIPGNRPGESGMDIDEEDILPDSEKDESLLSVTRNKINPNGFIFSIEDGEKDLSIRLSVDRTKFLLRHIIDAL